MKTNPPFALVAVFAVAMLLMAVVLMSRQSTMQGELSTLRAELETVHATAAAQAKAGARMEATQPVESSSSSQQRVGVSRKVDAEAPETRLRDLEYIVNSHADLLEGMLQEKARVDEVQRRAAMRAWGPEQATGEPDTMTAGDLRTAWAPAMADGGVEWIEAQFENPADLARVVVRQTNNPGGIVKVVAVTDTGSEIPIWQGQDPSKGKDLDDTAFSVPPGIQARKVKVYIDTSKLLGWEEVDAIQAVSRDGTGQWAKSINASSTYANGRSLSESVQYLEPPGNSFMILK